MCYRKLFLKLAVRKSEKREKGYSPNQYPDTLIFSKPIP